MERPPQRYFCNKCGYVGSSDTHPGCNYFAYPMAHLEQLYIDHLEAELAALRASPAIATEGWKSLTDVQWMNIVNLNHAWRNVDKEDAINEVVKLVEAKCKENNLAAAPTPPVSEDRKDAELLDYIQNHGATIQIVPMANRTFGFEVGGLHKSRKLSVREAIDAAMQEDKP